MNVICFSGQMRNGKDTAADYVASKINWHRSSFAADVKKTFMDMFEVDIDFVEKWKVSKDIPSSFIKNVRDSLIFIGDGFRQIMPDIWVKRCLKKGKYPMIISDGRYFSEIEKIKSLGGLNVLVYREGFYNEIDNASESECGQLVKFFLSNKISGSTAEFFNNYKGEKTFIYEKAKNVDYFLANNSSIEGYYQSIDNDLIPFIRRKIERCQD